MYAIRIRGRGLVTTINDQPIATRERAKSHARWLQERFGERCDVERVVLHVKADT